MTLTARNDSLYSKSLTIQLFVSYFTENHYDYAKASQAFSLILKVY